jgi:hypothetical protein
MHLTTYRLVLAIGRFLFFLAEPRYGRVFFLQCVGRPAMRGPAASAVPLS